jgi:signal transduction histidine kinase
MRGFRRFRTSRAWVATQSGGNWWKGGRALGQRDKRGETTYCHAGRTFDRTFCAKGRGPAAFVRRLDDKQAWILLVDSDMGLANPNARILIIDDEEASAQALLRILEQAGYGSCTAITDSSHAAKQILDLNPDLVLLDLLMEPISGLKVLNEINDMMSPRTRPLVLVLTADTSLQAKHDALASGASDFLSKPLDSVEVLLRIENLLTSRKLNQQIQLYSEGLERLVDKRTLELQQQTANLEKTLTELRATQQQVIQQERMRALGTMACGIAHDLNNGLSVILGYGDMLLADLERFPIDSKARTYLQEMVLAGCDNAKMVERLREFYRPRATREHRQAVDLNDVIEQAISRTAPKWQSEADAAGASIHIKKDLDGIPFICGTPDELREVFTNLIFNAVDAMPEGGRIFFRSREVGKHIRLEMSDTGIGMSEETLRNCMEPFFTTKGKRGSGLGLAMSYGIIRRHGGSIEIKSKPNKGTTFTIYLPVPEEVIEPADVEVEAKVDPLRILVVDDHAAIREIVSAYLAEDRHAVETAADAREAMAKFRSDRFDLVITDRAMPEISGDELAASIKEVEPNKPVIMLTGFADLLTEAGRRSENVDIIVSKPARLEDLRKAILTVVPKLKRRDSHVSAYSSSRPAAGSSFTRK